MFLAYSWHASLRTLCRIKAVPTAFFDLLFFFKKKKGETKKPTWGGYEGKVLGCIKLVSPTLFDAAQLKHTSIESSQA